MAVHRMLNWVRHWLQRGSRQGRRHLRNDRERFRRPRLEWLEDRCLPSVTLAQNFPGINVFQAGGPTPPDTILAVGPTSVIQGVNNAIQITDKAGNLIAGPQQFPSLFSPIFTSGHFFSDSFVVFDDLASRFYLCILEIDSSASFADLDFAVSNSANPTSLNAGAGAGDWTVFSKITAVREGSNTGLADFPKMGWNADGVFLTFNQFNTATGSFLHTQLLTISKASINSKVGQAFPTLTLGTDMFQADLSNVATLIPARMHGSSAGGPEFFVTTGGENPVNTIDVVRMTNFLSNSPVFSTTPIGVAAYNNAHPVPELTNLIDDRMLSVDWNNNKMVAAHTVGVPGDSVNHVHWYQFDTSGATPALAQQGDLSNPGHNRMYPGIAINNTGDVGLSFVESASSGATITQTASMFVTARLSGDPLGTMDTPVLARAGVLGAPTGGERGGDYSGTVFDPVDGSFWSANEFTAGTGSTDTWGTQIVNYSFNVPPGTPVSPPAITTLSQTSILEGTTGTTTLVVSGTGFDGGSVVRLNSTDLATTFFNNTVLSAQIPAFLLTEEGAFTITVFNSSSNTTSVGTPFTVVESLPAGSSRLLLPKMGTPFTGIVASFTDLNLAEPLTDFSATINWGDGIVDAGIVKATLVAGAFTVTGSHTYGFTGTTIPITVSIFDDGNQVLQVTSSANVSGVATAGQTRVREGGPGFFLTVSGTGFTKTSIAQFGGVNLTTTFVSDTKLRALVPAKFINVDGTFAVSVAGSGVLTSPASLTVVESLPNARPRSLTLKEGVLFKGAVATFTDPNFAKDKTELSAVIDWGDGTVDNATLSFSTLTLSFTVTGSHTYTGVGTGIPITITILDNGNFVQQITSKAKVLDQVLTAAGRVLTAPVGNPFTQVIASFIDKDVNRNISKYLATINWGDGTTSTGNLVSNSNGSFSVVGTHTFVTKKLFGYSVRIQDAGGAFVVARGTIRSGGGLVAVGADAGAAPIVKVFDANGGKWITIQAYENSFRGGVRVATGVMSGVPVVITAPGPGRLPLIKVFSRSTGELITSFLPRPSPTQDIEVPEAEEDFAEFTGGMYVALGDLNGDGILDLAISQGPGGIDLVEVFNGKFLTSTLALIGQPFQAFAGVLTNGITVAANAGQLLVGNGPGAPPVVGIYTFDGSNFVARKFFNGFAGSSLASATGGVFVAAGDFNGDGVSDVIVGAGAGSVPKVNVFDGTQLYLDTQTAPQLLSSFLAYASDFKGGVRVAAIVMPGLTHATIWTAPGPNSALRNVRQFFYLSPGLQPYALNREFLEAAFAGGAFVA